MKLTKENALKTEIKEMSKKYKLTIKEIISILEEIKNDK